MNPNRKINISLKDQRKRERKARAKGMHDAQKIVDLFPLLVLRDEYGFGKKRMTDYINSYREKIAAYNEGYLTLEDIIEVLEEEVNLDLSDVLEEPE